MSRRRRPPGRRPQPTPPAAIAIWTLPQRRSAGAAAAAAAACAAAHVGSVPHATTATPATSLYRGLQAARYAAKGRHRRSSAGGLIGFGWILSSAGSGGNPNSVVTSSRTARSVSMTARSMFWSDPNGVPTDDDNAPRAPLSPPGPNDTRTPDTGRTCRRTAMWCPARRRPDLPPRAPGHRRGRRVDGAYDAVTGQDIAGVASEAGFEAQLRKDNQGSPMIQGRDPGLQVHHLLLSLQQADRRLSAASTCNSTPPSPTTSTSATNR